MTNRIGYKAKIDAAYSFIESAAANPWMPAEVRKAARAALAPSPANSGLTYLATPYSHPDPAVMQDRFERACRIAGRLMAAGNLIFCPITHTHPIAVSCELPRGWEYWARYDRAMLGASNRLLVVQMDGWEESKGIAGEIAIAGELGIPVEYMAEEAEGGR